MTFHEKLEILQNKLKEGYTLYISTHLNTWKIAPKHIDFLKAKDDGLYMVRGKHIDCINYCKITASK